MNEPERPEDPLDIEEMSAASRWPLGMAGGLVLVLGVAGTAISDALGIPRRALLYLGMLLLIIILGRPAGSSPLSAQVAQLPGAGAARHVLGVLGAARPHGAGHGGWRAFGEQLLRYMLVGATTTLLDFGILNLMLQLLPSQLPIQVAIYSLTSYGATLVIGYLWHRQWTFRDGGRKRAIAWRFVLLNALTLGMNGLGVLVLTSALPLVLTLDALIIANISKGVATLASGSLNFLGNRTWVFQATQKRRQPRLEREAIAMSCPEGGPG